MTDFTLRAATEADIDGVLKIETLSFSDPWTKGMLLTELCEGVKFTLLLHGETVIGYSILDCRVLGEAELHNIAVSPDYRGRGLSGLLMDRIISDAKERRAEVIFLEVRAKNEAARGLYKKYGFTDIGVRKNYYKNPTEDAVIMQKLLI